MWTAISASSRLSTRSRRWTPSCCANTSAGAVSIASCYFAISEADLARMQDFMAGEINNLIRLTDVSAVGSSYSSKLVRVLLSPVQGESIHPVRLALRLDPDDFEEGVFAWKGFLY